MIEGNNERTTERDRRYEAANGSWRNQRVAQKRKRWEHRRENHGRSGLYSCDAGGKQRDSALRVQASFLSCLLFCLRPLRLIHHLLLLHLSCLLLTYDVFHHPPGRKERVASSTELTPLLPCSNLMHVIGAVISILQYTNLQDLEEALQLSNWSAFLQVRIQVSLHRRKRHPMPANSSSTLLRLL